MDKLFIKKFNCIDALLEIESLMESKSCIKPRLNLKVSRFRICNEQEVKVKSNNLIDEHRQVCPSVLDRHVKSGIKASEG